eukprot:366345-Chlamydomonas_euryale.AAC.19
MPRIAAAAAGSGAARSALLLGALLLPHLAFPLPAGSSGKSADEGGACGVGTAAAVAGRAAAAAAPDVSCAKRAAATAADAIDEDEGPLVNGAGAVPDFPSEGNASRSRSLGGGPADAVPATDAGGGGGSSPAAADMTGGIPGLAAEAGRNATGGCGGGGVAVLLDSAGKSSAPGTPDGGGRAAARSPVGSGGGADGAAPRCSTLGGANRLATTACRTRKLFCTSCLRCARVIWGSAGKSSAPKFGRP